MSPSSLPRSSTVLHLLVFLLFSFSLASSLPTLSSNDRLANFRHLGDGYELAVVGSETRRNLAGAGSEGNSSLVLAAGRTRRRDPTNNFERYTGGWNISNDHYWASVVFTAIPFFGIAAAWFVIFGISLGCICLCHCCCRREPYGYSRLAYALSLIFLILFTVSAIVGCVVLYTGQGKFHSSTSNTLVYVVDQAKSTSQNLEDVSKYLAAAKQIGVGSFSLPASVRNNIDEVETKINSSAATLSNNTTKNSRNIQDGLDSMRWSLIILAGVMLFLAFLGFLFSVLGLQCLVYTLVILGWILVVGTFILCGVFLLLHNVIADTCVAMDEWVQHPAEHTALDDIIPCVDNATAQETLLRTKDVTYQLVTIVNTAITNVSNRDFPPIAGPLYYNQSGPLLPTLCSPYNADLTNRQCASDILNRQHGLLPRSQSIQQVVYIGLVLLSAAVMLSLIFWVIYARERRHRVYTKRLSS
ncbi:hypothetical protein MLD38_005677 [Melastoma candidum]|uniref:Uncharacterized protein n=1 Tax=Melastoma candidum TaxID=119954 RepID=A0ACB9RJU9_9MYRT|nr:hypothetical protein MLD38_005677 [Melastoma candidum]